MQRKDGIMLRRLLSIMAVFFLFLGCREEGCTYDEHESKGFAQSILEKDAVSWGNPTSSHYEDGNYYFYYKTPDDENNSSGPRGIIVDCVTGNAEYMPRKTNRQ